MDDFTLEAQFDEPRTPQADIEPGTLDLRCCDCMELMAEFPDKHFDLAIVDPPYGIGAEHGTNRASRREFKQKAIGWDASAPDPQYFVDLIRVSKKQIIWGANHFISKIPGALVDSKHWIIWDKKNPDRNFADCELAWGSNIEPARILDIQRVQSLNRLDGGKIHPTQKPVALYRWLLERYAKPGMRILDTHLGSGSHAIAAHYAGVHLTACEIDPDYFHAAKERIARETSQKSLFI